MTSSARPLMKRFHFWREPEKKKLMKNSVSLKNKKPRAFMTIRSWFHCALERGRPDARHVTGPPTNGR
jgi:hypothetical protein